ncbi:hypothetical protein [Companilactobacillus sp. DQM5]|uniref:hypothetical protein n=1 Tax=Companilactobacillus sp. DQM5 TaxID=3463359 RepID=UPI004057F150
MWKKLSDDERIEFTKNGYKKLKKNSPIVVNGKNIGYVRKVVTDSSGQQAYVITPTKTEKIKKSKNIAIIYRGSSANVSLDAIRDWANNDIPMGTRVLVNKIPFLSTLLSFYTKGKYRNGPSSQLINSSKTLNKLMKDYPNAKFDIYGHSLGSMDGQYAVANALDLDRIRAAYLYEGPNIYSILTSKQVKQLKKLNPRIFNFIDKNDWVSLGYSDDKNSVGTLHIILSKNMGLDKVSQHMWGGYQYDKNGNIKLVPENQLQIGMLNLNLLKDKLSKGGLSKSDKIYLDSAAAVILADNIKTYVDESMDSLIKDLNGYISEAEDLWKDTKRRARGMGQDLSEDDIMNTLRQVNATKSEFVTKVIEYYQDKIKKAEQVKSDYSDISTNIKKGVQAKLETDQELARSFNLL